MSQHSYGNHYVTNNPSFYTNFPEETSWFLQIHMKNTLFVQTTASPITTIRRVFLSGCKYPIILLGNVEELLKNLDTFCFTYQHVDCLYTPFKYRFSGKIIAKSGQVFDYVQGAVDFNHRNKGNDRMPSIAKKTVKEKVQKIFSAPFKRQKQRRPVVQCLQKESRKLKRSKLNWN